MKPEVWRRRSPLVFLFVTVFVDMIGYGIVVPLLPFYAGLYASGAERSRPLSPRCRSAWWRTHCYRREADGKRRTSCTTIEA